MSKDTKNAPPFPRSSLDDLDLDLPPSYDIVATEPPYSADESAAGSSSLTPALQTRAVPKHLLHLFTTPSNAENLLGRDQVPNDQITRIEWRKRGKNIESWDPKLSDPNVLYDFLRAMAMTPPTVKFRCFGAHMVTHERDETVFDPDGTPRIKKRGHTEQVVDFDFTIDLSSIINHPDNNAHIHLSALAPYAPYLRGTHKPTYAATFAPPPPHHGSHRATHRGYTTLNSADEGCGPTAVGRRAARRELNAIREYDAWRLMKGIPRWIRMEDCPAFLESRGKGKTTRRGERGIALNDAQLAEEIITAGRDVESTAESSSRQLSPGVVDVGEPELREWCRAFCADQGLLKEFFMFKSLWGWDVEGVFAAIKGAVLSTGYQSNHLSITFDVDPLAVVVRPNNTFSRALGNPFIYFLSWITLIYPLIWIWKRLHSLGGAPWAVGRVSYAMKCYPPLPTTYPTETVASAQARLPSLYKIHPELPRDPVLQYGPKGVHYLVGRKEGEWFREWEERVRMGVRMRYKGELQGGLVGEGRNVDLDGY